MGQLSDIRLEQENIRNVLDQIESKLVSMPSIHSGNTENAGASNLMTDLKRQIQDFQNDINTRLLNIEYISLKLKNQWHQKNKKQ